LTHGEIMSNNYKPNNDKIGFMPEYYQYSDYKGHSISVSPVKWRKLFQKWPYFVGQKISLKITFKPVSPKAKENPLWDYVLWEIHSSNLRKAHQLRLQPGISNQNEEFIYSLESLPVMQQGEFSVYVGTDNGEDPVAPLFSASPIHKDRIRWEIFLIIISAVFGAILGGSITLLFALVAFRPVLEVFITP